MTLKEHLSRKFCEFVKINPEDQVHGMGWYLPKDFKGKAHEGYAYLIDHLLAEQQRFETCQ